MLECSLITDEVAIRARSLGPLEKTRAFGMTPVIRSAKFWRR